MPEDNILTDRVKREFSFTPMTEEEKRQRTQDQKRIKELAETASRDLSECLQYDCFKRYREEYKKLREELLRYGKNLKLTDPIEYAIAAHSIFDQINIIGNLLEAIKKEV